MKTGKTISAVLLIILLPLLIYTQEIYKVTASKLNVRNDIGANAEVIGQLDKDQQIKVLKISDGWAEIEYNNENGYVAEKYIVKISFKSDTENNNENDDYSDPFWIYIGIIIIVLYYVFYRYKKRCRKCKKWGAMKQISKELKEEKPTHIKKSFDRKNKKGEVTSTYEKPVPATKYLYLITEQCKYCSAKNEFYKTKTKEN